MKICSQCHKHFPDKAHFCPKCGIPLVEISDPFLGKVLLGQFEIVELIGEGSMGKVYQAKQVSVDRHVAVKVLKKKLRNDPNVFLRFQREARAAARLNHPNIITVHLVGETEDEKIPYMVMEYVEGNSLEIVCKAQGVISTLRLLSISRQICLALHEAHSNNVIHRDLKPDNISILQMGTPRETVKVLDFGIAKILHTDEEFANLTKTGTIFGTPAYISPEQASGEPLDPRTDLYSLGVIMFRMATGRLPFQDASGLEILVRHIKEIPPSPSSLNPEIPKGLDDIINKLLKKDPAERFSTTDELINAIDHLILDLGGTTMPSGEVTGPTEKFSSSELSEGVSGFSSPSVEKNGGKGLKYFIILFSCIVIAAIFLIVVLKYTGKSSDDNSSDNSTSKEIVNKKKDTVLDNKKVNDASKIAVNTAKKVPKVSDSNRAKECNFLFEKPSSQRLTCMGKTVDIKISVKKRNRKVIEVILYVPGISLKNAFAKKIDKKQGLHIFKSRRRLKEKDKSRFLVRCKRFGRAEFSIFLDSKTHLADVMIDFSNGSTGRKHYRHRHSSKNIKPNKDSMEFVPKIPDLTPETKPMLPPSLPPPPMLPSTMKSDAPSLPDAPGFIQG